MKIALIADLHLGVRSDSDIIYHHHEKFFKDVFFPYIDEHKITTCIDLGDTFDRRKYINFKTLDFAKKSWFDQLANRGVSMHIILGNHCTYFKNTNRVNSSNLLLGEYKNVTVYSEPKDVDFDGLTIAMIPWINADNVQLTTDFVKQSKGKICCGHFEFAGFQVLKGINHEHGADATEYSKFDRVFSGHFHYRHGNGHISYLGTPIQMTWSDYGEIKGFHVLDTTTREVEFIPNPNQFFIKYMYDDSKERPRINDKSLYEKCYVKIMVLNKTNPYFFDKFVEELQECSPAHLTIVEDVNEYAVQDTDSVNLSNDTVSIINEYVDMMQLTDDKTEIKKIAYQLYLDAMSNNENAND